MSRFFSDRYASLTPYTPGEQPQDMTYIKLNTNESPFPPSERVRSAVAEAAPKLHLYSDPECKRLRQKMSEVFGLPSENIIMANGSDEILNFAFMAFADEQSPLVFPNITYGFYPVFAKLNRIPYEEIPLRDDFTIDVQSYCGIDKTIVIANPNAPTGICLPVSDIEKIVSSNPRTVVIVDEAYIDFGGESAIGLTKKYDNLFVTGTFSKSRSMAGARLGFGFGSGELIADLNTIRYSTNPYNINSLTAFAGMAALEDNRYYMDHCRIIAENRSWTEDALKRIGFTVLPSKANFLLARSDLMDGETLYRRLKERGVLVRHFSHPLISDYIRITVGAREQMVILMEKIKEILEKTK